MTNQPPKAISPVSDAMIAAFLKKCAADAKELGSGRDFNQGVVRGLEIAAAQIENGHHRAADQSPNQAQPLISGNAANVIKGSDQSPAPLPDEVERACVAFIEQIEVEMRAMPSMFGPMPSKSEGFYSERVTDEQREAVRRSMAAAITAMGNRTSAVTEEMREAVAQAIAPCLERAHNEYQIADAAIAAMSSISPALQGVRHD